MPYVKVTTDRRKLAGPRDLQTRRMLVEAARRFFRERDYWPSYNELLAFSGLTIRQPSFLFKIACMEKEGLIRIVRYKPRLRRSIVAVGPADPKLTRVGDKVRVDHMPHTLTMDQAVELVAELKRLLTRR